MPFILGVTGGIGSGKTAATDQFASHGITIIDADIISRSVVSANSPTLSDISNHFGSDILLENGELNRPQLRQIIFDNPQEKQWLENLLHPIIRTKIQETLKSECKKTKHSYIILSAPLLLENNLQTATDRVLVIDCNEDIQVERASKRDDNDPEVIKKIIQQQLNRSERLARADDIIINNGTLTGLKEAVDHYHSKLIKELT